MIGRFNSMGWLKYLRSSDIQEATAKLLCVTKTFAFRYFTLYRAYFTTRICIMNRQMHI